MRNCASPVTAGNYGLRDFLPCRLGKDVTEHVLFLLGLLMSTQFQWGVAHLSLNTSNKLHWSGLPFLPNFSDYVEGMVT